MRLSDQIKEQSPNLLSISPSIEIDNNKLMNRENKKDKQQKTKTKDIEIIDDKHCLELNSATNQILSEHIDEYRQFINGSEQFDFLQHCGADLQKNKIQYHPKIFTEKILIEIIDEKREGKIEELKVRLSYFTFIIQVYTHDYFSKTRLYLEQLGQGAFGTVFKYIDKKKSFAIKSLKFGQNLGQIKGNIVKTIQQYCIYKLASLLKIGPLITSELGFDLIIYEDCVQFSLQLCQSPTPSLGQKMKDQLKLLHSLKIVHGDIKEENIMFSQAFNKNVFIDFNCSSAIKEEIGYKTLTNFKGTLENTLPQLQKLFLSQKSAYVDLYYNDVYALKQVRIKKKDKKKYSEQYEFDESLYSYICFCYHLNLRYYYFILRSDILQQFISNNLQQLVIPKQLKQKICQQNGRGLYLQLVQEMNNIINDTVELCYELTLNPNAIKGSKIIMKYFKIYNFNEKIKKQTNEQMHLRRLSKFKWHQQQLIAEKRAYESFDVLQVLLPSIYLYKGISNKFSIFQKMKQLDKKNQQEFVKLYEKLIYNYCEEYVIKKAIKLFEARGYVNFENSESFIDKLLKIDKHYSIGKYKNRYRLKNMKENNCSEKRFGIQSYFMIEKLMYKLKSINPSAFEKEFLEYLCEKLIEIFKLKYQHWFQLIEQCQLHFKNAVKQYTQDSSLKFILQFLRYFACLCTKSSDPFQNIQKYKKSSWSYLKQFADKRRLSQKLYALIQEQSIHNYSSIYNTKTGPTVDELIYINQFFQYMDFSYFCFRKIYLSLMFNLQTERDINDLFKNLCQTYPCEHCFMIYLSRLLTVVHNNPFKKQLISEAQKYFCQIQLAQIDHPHMHSVIQQFNQSFMLQIKTKEEIVYFKKYQKWLQDQYVNKNYPLNSIKVRTLFLARIGQDQKCLQIINNQLGFYLQKSSCNQQDMSKLIWISYIHNSVADRNLLRRIPECDQIVSKYFNNLSFSQDLIYGDTKWLIGNYLLSINDFKKLIFFWNQISLKCNQQNKNIFSVIIFFHIRKLVNNSILDFSSKKENGLVEQLQFSLFKNYQQYSGSLISLVMLALQIILLKQKFIFTTLLQLFQFIQKSFIFIFRKNKQMTEWLQRRVSENIIILLFLHRQLAQKIIFSIQKQSIIVHLKSQTKMMLRYFRKSLYKPQYADFRDILRRITKKQNIKSKIIKNLITYKLLMYIKNRQQSFICQSHIIQPTIRKQYERYLNGN